MHHKGLVPIIYLLIGAVLIASAVFGVAKYGDKITANASKIIKPKIVVYNIVSTTSSPSLLKDLPDELTAEETNPPVEQTDGAEDKKQVEATEESTSIIEKLKKEIEALKKQPPSVIYKEIIKEIISPASVLTPKFELTPISTPTSPQTQNQDTASNDSGKTPDLAIRSSSYYPSTPVKEDVMSFFATIRNQGEGSANSSMISISIDGTIVGKASIMALSPNKAETVTWGKIWKATYGNHALVICADADSEVTESDETNNCYSVKFSVSKTILLPDYVIDSVMMTPNSPVAGDALSFVTIVRNQGNAPAGNSSVTSLKIDIGNNGDWNIIAKNAITEAMDQGVDGKEYWDFVWAATRGTHKYEICADATSLVVESDENNNCLAKILIIP